jgi:predicted kinase
MLKVYVLVGVPAAGKSTWVKNQTLTNDYVYISTDHHVEAHAKKLGLTYNEVFADFMPMAIDLMMDDVINARETGNDIIWDQTSTTIASRKRKFNMLKQYTHIAVVFPTPNRDELDVRLSGRAGKHIPKNVVDSMIAQFQMPTTDEGYSEIIIIN